jgi:hypothetical protein
VLLAAAILAAWLALRAVLTLTIRPLPLLTLGPILPFRVLLPIGLVVRRSTLVSALLTHLRLWTVLLAALRLVLLQILLVLERLSALRAPMLFALFLLHGFPPSAVENSPFSCKQLPHRAVASLAKK